MINLGNYLFFAIFSPLIILGLLVLYYSRGEKYRYLRFALICIILLIGHILLPFFNVGIFPDLTNDPIFYLILFLLGIGFTISYISLIENISFKKIGWKSENLKKEFIIGLLFGFIILTVSAVLKMPFLKNSIPDFSILKVLTMIFFAAGAIYEESLFRGLLQTHYLEKENIRNYQIILIPAVAFLFINLSYFPFNPIGLVNYLIMFLMSVTVGWLALKYSLISSTTAHFTFVLLAGLLS